MLSRKADFYRFQCKGKYTVKIQNATDHAIRILQYLHMNKEEICAATTIAEANGMTYSLFTKIASQLKKDNLLYAEQGRKGGYRLGRSANLISVYDVFLCIEGELSLSRCFQADYICKQGDLGHCRLRNLLSGMQTYLIEQMAQQSIGDLVI